MKMKFGNFMLALRVFYGHKCEMVIRSEGGVDLEEFSFEDWDGLEYRDIVIREFFILGDEGELTIIFYLDLDYLEWKGEQK